MASPRISSVKFSDTEPDPAADPSEVGQDLPPDPEPGYVRPSWRDTLLGSSRPRPPKPPRNQRTKTDGGDKPPTAAVRRDIRAKLTMFLTMFGTAWSARDPHCGQAMLDAVADQDTDSGTAPGIATALADIVCDSPDMVRWFTSGGGYMKWLTLAAAAQPVLTMVFAHHISHSVRDEPDGDPGPVGQDWSMYAAS